MEKTVKNRTKKTVKSENHVKKQKNRLSKTALIGRGPVRTPQPAGDRVSFVLELRYFVWIKVVPSLIY
jgi:hypothetical protein